MASFKVGEIAILCNLVGVNAKYIGAECEIIEGLAQYVGPAVSLDGHFAIINSMSYKIRVCDGLILLAKPHVLRKKYPPVEYTGETRIAELFLGKPQLEEMACAA